MAALCFQFPFDCSIGKDEYRKLWQSTLVALQGRFDSLRILRSADEIGSFLNDLDDFDLMRRNEDVNGLMWQDVHPDAAFRDEAKQAQEAFNVLDSEVTNSSALAKNLALYEATIKSTDDDTKRMLGEWTRLLRQGGAHLDPEKQSQVQELTAEIQKANTDFKANIREDSRHIEVSVDDTRGVPDDFLVTHPADEKSGKIRIFGKWADISPILDYCHSQAVREQASRLWETSASPVNETVLKRLLEMRREKAGLLGYKDWAEYQLEGTMAKTPDIVFAFLDSVFDAINPRFEKEKTIIARLLREQDQIDMKPWDLRYGQMLLKSRLLPGFDPKDARQYFPITIAFPAMQRIAQDLFRLRFEPVENLPAWHPSVSASLVYDTSSDKDKLLGRLFFDIYHRDEKSDGARTWSIRPSVPNKQLAEVILEADLESRPGACLSYEELKILLHELGHCVHAMLGKQRYSRLSGPEATQMDFMEVPSQLLELWLADKTHFNFAVNEKGHRIPEDLLDKLVAAEEIGRGLHHSGQLVFARLALELHTSNLNPDTTTTQITEAVFLKYGPIFLTPDTSRHHSFHHLANPLYASRYYVYLFAIVICHDLFTRFSKGGDLMRRDAAMHYRREILEQGGAKDGEEMVKAFLGRPYKAEAFKKWMDANLNRYS